MNEIKQGYKQTDIGVIPEDWKEGKIRNFCSMKSGNSITSERISERGEFPCYGGNGLRGYTNKFTHSGKYTLVGRQGALCGNVNYVNSKFFASEHAIVTTPFSNSDALFLAHAFERMNLNQYTESSAQPGLSVNKVLDLPFGCPPTLTEQIAIATALSDVDALIAALEKKITKKQQIKQGTMQQLLTGKKRLPGFSGDWVEKKLGDCFNKVVGGGTPSRSVAEYWNGNIPWATVKDFASFNPKFTQENITSLGLHNSASHLIPKETPITSTRMGLGKIMIYSVDVAINQDMKALFISEDYEKNYIIHWFVFSQEKIELMGTGSTVKGIRLEQLNDIEIHLPHTKSEQTAIAQILTDMDNEISQLEADRDKYMQIKAGMMQQLLTGKIRLVN